MKILKEKKENNILTVEVEEDFSKVEKAMDSAFKELAKQVKIPGFRKGKIPRTIFEKNYGKESLYEKASSTVMNEAYPDIIKELDIKPIDYPSNVQILSIEESKPFVFSLSIPVEPEIKLGKYKGIKIKNIDGTVSDQDIENEIEVMRDRYAEFVEVNDKKVEDGDMLEYTMKATADGEEITDWTKEDGGTKVGTSMIHDKFDKALIGAEVNKPVIFSIEFEDDYRFDFAKGKKVDFEVTVKQIREKKLPELDDEFAKKISAFESFSEFKTDLKEKMTEHKKNEAEQKMREELIEAIIGDIKVEVPDVMIRRETDNMLKQFDMSLRNSGLNLENYLKFTGKDPNSIKEEYKEPASNKVKADLAITAISKKEKIEATDEEVIDEVKKMAERTGSNFDDLMKNINEDYKSYVKSYLVYDKTVKFLMDNAKISK